MCERLPQWCVGVHFCMALWQQRIWRDDSCLLGSMAFTGGLRLDLQHVAIARHHLVEHWAYDSAKE